MTQVQKNLQERLRKNEPLEIIMLAPLPPRIGGLAFSNNEIAIGLVERGHYVQCISQFPEEVLD